MSGGRHLVELLLLLLLLSAEPIGKRNTKSNDNELHWVQLYVSTRI